MKEVVSYYNGRNTNVYACLLDATKAFDCVRYDKLFELLLKKDIPGTYAVFGYADDLLLLSPSIHGLEMLVETSESFASEYGVTFNAKKQSAYVLVKMHAHYSVK